MRNPDRIGAGCEGGGRADGLRRPIERFSFEWLSGLIGSSRMMSPTGDGFKCCAEAASEMPPLPRFEVMSR